MTATRVPPIPAPTDTNLRDVARAVKNVLDVREGLLGDPLDANVTFRDLKDGGIIDVSTVRRGGGSGSLIVAPPIGGEGSDYDPTKDLTTPPAPTGFTVTGLFAAIRLAWNAPTAAMRNYAYTEVWRSNTNNIGSAVRIGSAVAPMYLDYVGNGQTYYYWVRFVSQANITGPYNSTAGTVGAAAPDPEYLLDLLTGEITESQLYEDLGDRISLIDGPDTLPNSVANRILAEATARQAAITSEALTRQTADSSLALQITTLTASVATNAAAIQTEATTRATADTAEAAQRTTLAARVTTAEGAITTNAAAIQTEATTRAAADAAEAAQRTTLAARVTTAEGAITANAAAIQTEATTRATADTANANLTNQVQARLDTGDYAAVKTQSSVSASKIGGLEAQYSVKIDLNGHVSGFGLSSTAVNGTPTSAFIVRADRFALAGPNDTTDPLGTLNPTRLPFVVTTSSTTINGVTVPAGTYINTAFIGSATITKAQIGSIYADRIEAGFASSVDIESAKFYGSEFYIGGTVTYEFNDTQRPTQKTGIAQVSNYNIALRPTGAEFDVGYFKIKNGGSLTVPFEVVNNVVRITRAAIGTITANEIDSRNLTIKDSAGNVVFSAEGGLAAPQLNATAGGVNLLANSTFRSKYSNPNNANDPDTLRPFNYGAYNNAGVPKQWVNATGFTDASAFGLRCLAWTASQFGLYTTNLIQEDGLSGGVYGGWKPNTTYVVSFRAKSVRAALAFNQLQSAVTAASTQLVLQDASQFPAPNLVGGSYYVFFTDGDEATWEGMLVSAKSGNTLTVSRGQWGTASARAIGARVQIGFTNFQLGWNVAPAQRTDVANPVLSTDWKQYTFRVRWESAVEPDGGLYLSMFGTKRNGEEIHIDELQVQEGDVPSAWGPSERDAVSTLNPITPSNVGSYVGADAIGITQLGTTLQTTNFGATAGWQIKKDGTATFNSVKVRGEINGGAFTGYAWPTAGQSGFHLGPNGLALGNANDGKYFLVESSGNLYAPGLTIIDGVLSIGQPNAVNTVNIAGSAVTVSTYAEGYLPTMTLTPSEVLLCNTSITINGLSAGQTAGTILTANIVLYEGGGGAAAIRGAIRVNGSETGVAACTLGDSKTMTINAFVNLANGTHTLSVYVRTQPESGGASSKNVTVLGYITAISGKR